MEDTEHLESAWRELQPAADRLAKEAKALRRIAAALALPSGYDSLKAVGKALAAVESLEAVPGELAERARLAARPVQDWLDAQWDVRADRFADAVREHFEARAVPLAGEPPALRAAPVELRVDAAKDRVDLYYAGEPVKQAVPMAPDRVFAGREAALLSLRRGATAPDALAAGLIEAYGVLRQRGEGKRGGRVSLPEVHLQLFVERQTAQSRTTLTRGRIKEYPRAQFAWDLAGLLDAPHFLKRDGRTIELLAPTPSAAGSRAASVLVARADGTESPYGWLRVS